MFASMAKALEKGKKEVVQPAKLDPKWSRSKAVVACTAPGARNGADRSLATATVRPAGGLAFAAESQLLQGAVKTKAAPNHKEMVEKLVKLPKVSENDTREWGESVAAMEANLASSLATSTGSQYSYWWGRFEVFCDSNKREAMPFSSATVAVFLSHLAETAKGLGGVDSARAALHHYFNLSCPGEICPTDSSEVVLTIKGIKRRFQKPVVKKTPLKSEDFFNILSVSTDKGDFTNVKLGQLRLAAQVTVMYCAFARYEEVAALRMSQITFEGSDLVVSFTKGKTYQYGEARSSVIAGQPQLAINPVEVVKQYVARLGRVQGQGEGGLLFPSFRCTSLGYSALDKAASYDCVNNQFKEAVIAAKVSPDASSYGLHSMRRGAVTAAVNSDSVSDHAIMKQMRVASTSTVRRYATLDKKSLKKASNAIFL